MTTETKIIDEFTKCNDEAVHPTTHRKGCNCDHCWEEEMAIRWLWGQKLTTKVVWKRRVAAQHSNGGAL